MDVDPAESEFPAAVLCARCGKPDCSGCAPPSTRSEPTGAPGWDAGDEASLRMLWQTAHRSVVDGESFFASLPDGRLGRALSFAFACELLAVASLVAVWCAALFALAPSLLHGMWRDEEVRHLLGGAILFSVPAFAWLMVVLHIVWGVSVELGLRLQGAPTRMSHAVRYSLYACGWDLLTSPFGFAAAALSSNPSQALREVRFAVRIPRLATRAFLMHARSATELQARRAVWTAATITATLVVVSTVAGLAFAIAASV